MNRERIINWISIMVAIVVVGTIASSLIFVVIDGRKELDAMEAKQITDAHKGENRDYNIFINIKLKSERGMFYYESGYLSERQIKMLREKGYRVTRIESDGHEHYEIRWKAPLP